MKIYQENLAKLQQEAQKLAVSDRRISIARLLTLLAASFLFYQGYPSNVWLLAAGAISSFTFLLLIKQHSKTRWNHELVKKLIQINEDEINFLEGDSSCFKNGEEFIQHDHAYSYDLDFFGDHSLFQYLNRTGTVTGKRILAQSLLKILGKDEIKHTQESVKELSSKLEWRQHFLALANIYPDTEESLSELTEWTQRKPIKISGFVRLLSYLIPIVTISCFAIYFFTPYEVFWRFGLLGFLINLGILASFGLAIKGELIPTTKIERILRQYAHLLRIIEQTPFTSTKLQSLRSQLIHGNEKASTAIHQLSLLFGRMEHVSNAFASPALNGLLLYHIHVLKGLSEWRKKHAVEIMQWLEVIGAIEQLNSLANFGYNNPEFVFPNLNDEQKISFENLGHPLLAKKKAITNSISFDKERFFILTGSNMSGKSTFLRTVGINMVLAGIGSPVFATKANINPLPVLVSMRLSDSLTDSESYFYAEVKRLKSIMEQLDQESCFVLLDEILRGTNSDDKRNGTIEVIRKMAGKKAYGGIATHDLEVCKVRDEYPKILTNKRFEVEIINDELVFDYKLRDGICENKSASFIMKKMGVI